ncbi:SLAM family member 5-like isoform X2 [Coturnix japonica]|uniref:SLAM family member 5-like isoform X2 n=1 Tax=Coturnix japonica TaxID=93934 RepID=UPI000777C97F|nr:SLAM family member 5-like isoform X2 [Coturnix japonica]
MFWWLLLTSLLQQASKVCASDGMDVAAAEGKSVTFHLQNLIGENLVWSFRGEPILFIKLGAPPEVTVTDKSFMSRVVFPSNGSSLTILQLRRSDSGTYLAKNNEFKMKFILHVYRELSEPTVSCTRWNCSAESCSYMLHCSVDPPEDSSFFWSYNEQPESEEPELLVVERQHPADPDPLPYTCTAKNPISSRNTTVFPSALCADTFSSRHTVTIVGFVIGLLSLLAIIIIAIKLKGRRSHNLPGPASPRAGLEAENTTVYAEVGSIQQMHVFPREQKGDPKKSPASDLETSKTIYATVQNVAQSQTDDEKMSSRMLGHCEQEKSPYSTVAELYPIAQPCSAHMPAVSMDLLSATGDPSQRQGDEHSGDAVLTWDKSSDHVLPSG